MAITEEFVDAFTRAMIRVEGLVYEGMRLSFDNPDLSERHLADALALADEFGMHRDLRIHIAESAAERYRMELARRS